MPHCNLNRNKLLEQNETIKQSNVILLHDQSIMTWGTYKGYKLKDIPDTYWFWLLQQSWSKNYPHHVKYAQGLETTDVN